MTAGGKSFSLRRTFGAGEASKIDFASNRGSGRLLEYDVATKKTIVLISGFNFPNGLVIKSSDTFKVTIIMAEMMRFRAFEIDITTGPITDEPSPMK